MNLFGFRASDYPGSPGEIPDGFAYFAKDRSIAEQFARHYKEGIIEVKIPAKDYQALWAQYEHLYEGGPRVELTIPREVVEQLNRYEREWHPE